MSDIVLARGWNISCLVPEYRGRDYRTLTAPFNRAADGYRGDVVFPGNVCCGRDLHPYEAVFIKTNRGVGTREIASLTTAAGP